jgi:hypothetical protein
MSVSEGPSSKIFGFFILALASGVSGMGEV